MYCIHQFPDLFNNISFTFYKIIYTNNVHIINTCLVHTIMILANDEPTSQSSSMEGMTTTQSGTVEGATTTQLDHDDVTTIQSGTVEGATTTQLDHDDVTTIQSNNAVIMAISTPSNRMMPWRLMMSLIPAATLMRATMTDYVPCTNDSEFSSEYSLSIPTIRSISLNKARSYSHAAGETN